MYHYQLYYFSNFSHGHNFKKSFSYKFQLLWEKWKKHGKYIFLLKIGISSFFHSSRPCYFFLLNEITIFSTTVNTTLWKNVSINPIPLNVFAISIDMHLTMMIEASNKNTANSFSSKSACTTSMIMNHSFWQRKTHSGRYWII